MKIARIIILSLTFTIFSAWFNAQSRYADLNVKKIDLTEEAKKTIKQQYEWEIFIKALTWVESRHDPKAKNEQTSATGLFQQLNIYVEEANRIVGYNKFKLSDRKNPKKSREMFDVIQNFYNPNKDIKKAMVLHRGKKDRSHELEVLNKMKEYGENFNFDDLFLRKSL